MDADRTHGEPPDRRPRERGANGSRILPTLQKQGSELAAAARQRQILAGVPLARSFQEALSESGLAPLGATGIDTLQINVGRRCNQTCRHCHVDAGPDRKEMMPDAVVDRCLEILESTDIPTLDITGGAPELHTRWREIVRRARAAGKQVMDRCNLTITQLPNYAYLPEFFAEHRVHVIASLPHYRQKGTDSQRGDGVFEQSIRALQQLNALGYGREGTGLLLDLVTNPVGTFLPGNQAVLQAEWKRQMARLYGIEFSALYTITNMPISRFLEFLEAQGRLGDYLETLVSAFNPAAAAGVMCRSTLSVGWDGALYDCDFNQMLEMPVHPAAGCTVFDFDLASLGEREIVVGPHCFGCTAGAGSSCGGATA